MGKLGRKLKRKFLTQKPWKVIGWFVYGIVGITALVTLIWAILKIIEGSFFSTMGFWGSIGFWILEASGLNHLLKFLVGKDLFGN